MTILKNLNYQQAISGRFKSRGGSQFELTIIEAPEAAGFEFESAGYVQCVQGSCSESWAVAPSQLRTSIPYLFG